MKPHPGPSGWSAGPFRVLMALLLALWLSGLALFAFEADFAAAWAEDLLPWRHGTAMWHGGLAWCWAVWAGRHVWPHIGRCKGLPMTRRRWVAGWTMGLLLLGLMLTAWGLMYGSADWHGWISAAHFWPGLMLPLLMGAHWIGPSLKRRRPRPLAVGPTRSPSPRPRAKG